MCLRRGFNRHGTVQEAPLLRQTKERRSPEPDSKVFTYRGPDSATVDLLRSNYSSWFKAPATFWAVEGTTSARRFQDPQIEVVASGLQLSPTDAHSRILYRIICLALDEVRGWGPCGSAEIVTTSLYATGDYGASFNQLLATVNDMIIAESRYKLMERDLGRGSAFVLGMDVPETTCGLLLGI